MANQQQLQLMDDYQYMGPQRITYDGKRMRSKPINRKTVDFNSPLINYFNVISSKNYLTFRFDNMVGTTEITPL